jgi:hypothetical protein
MAHLCASVAGVSSRKQRTYYLLSDIGHNPVNRGAVGRAPRLEQLSDATLPQKPRASEENRYTLAPFIPSDCSLEATALHRALHFWNWQHMADFTFGQLPPAEQAAVRRHSHAIELQLKAHRRELRARQTANKSHA